MELILETTRLTLISLTLDDVDITIELWTDKRVMQYLWEPETEEDVIAEMPLCIRRGASGAIGVWLVRDSVTFEKLGTACLLPLPIDEEDTNWDLLDEVLPVSYEVEIGHMFKPDAWGKGVATEAVNRVLEFAFESLEIDEIVAVIENANQASRNVLLKSGFRETGKRKANNRMRHGFRITREGWLNSDQDSTAWPS